MREFQMKKLDKPMNRTSRRLKLKLGIAGVCMLIVLSLSVVGVIAIGRWFDSNKIVAHQVITIKVQPPFTIEPREPKVVVKKEVKTPRVVEVAEAAEVQERPQAEPAGIDQIVATVRTLESTNGTAPSGHHVTCRNKGMSNEYGYGVYSGLCFDTHEEATKSVAKWFTRELQNLTLGQALCKYNTGNASDSCVYYEDYLSLQ